MGLFNAISKFALRNINDSITKKQTEKAKEKAQNNAKKKIQNARRKKRPINVNSTYKAEYKKELSKVDRKANNREKFIDDLFE